MDRKQVYYDKVDRHKELATEYQLRNQMVRTHEEQTQILNKHDWFETNETCKKCSFLTGAFAAKTRIGGRASMDRRVQKKKKMNYGVLLVSQIF